MQSVRNITIYTPIVNLLRGVELYVSKMGVDLGDLVMY